TPLQHTLEMPREPWAPVATKMTLEWLGCTAMEPIPPPANETLPMTPLPWGPPAGEREGPTPPRQTPRPMVGSPLRAESGCWGGAFGSSASAAVLFESKLDDRYCHFGWGARASSVRQMPPPAFAIQSRQSPAVCPQSGSIRLCAVRPAAAYSLGTYTNRLRN